MKSLKAKFALLLLSTLGFFAGAHAQLTPSADAYTNTATPTKNFGAATLLDVESSQTAYIQFNLSSIPAGYTSANITQATLKLYVNTVTTGGSFNVDYVNGTWSESTITANLAPALGTTIAASVPLTTADKNQYILINVTAAVQAWLSGTANDGMALVGNSPVNATFDSKETTSTSHPAELDIVFTPGSGGGITGIITSSSSGLIGGGTSGTLDLSLTTACGAKEILQWSGSAWTCASPGTGTITGVTAGTDLTGGGSSGTVTVNVDTTKVPQLAAANTFTGFQTINNAVSITSSTAPLTVNSTSTSGIGVQSIGEAGLYGQDNVVGGYGVIGLDTQGEGYGLYGESFSFGTGVFGSGNQGLWGTDSGTDGIGVFATDSSGIGYGVYALGGTGVYANGNGTAVDGFGTGVIATGTGIGVYASVGSGSGTDPGLEAGVWGDVGGGGNISAVIGTAIDSYAGDFLNNSAFFPALYVDNSIQAGFASVFSAVGAYGSCTIYSNGNLNCTGGTEDVVNVDNGARKVALNSVQSPENWFEDFGSGSLSNGAVTIKLDPTFAETVNTGIEYHVFLTPKGDCKGLYFSNENAKGFDVRELGGGTSNVTFDYRIVAKRLGYENVRLADLTDEINRQDAQRQKMQSRMHSGASPIAIPKPPALPKPFGRPKLPALSVHAAMKPVAAQPK
jgi:hypothetical protein